MAEGVEVTSYRPPVREFSVHSVAADGGPRVLEGIGGPSMLIVTQGVLCVRAGDAEIVVERGESLFQAAGPDLVVTSCGGSARAYITTVGG